MWSVIAFEIYAISSIYCDVCPPGVCRICCGEVLVPFFPHAKYGHICIWRVCLTVFFRPLTMRNAGGGSLKWPTKMWRMQCQMSDNFHLMKKVTTN